MCYVMESCVIKGMKSVLCDGVIYHRGYEKCYVMESFVIKGMKSVLCDGVICHRG